MSTESTEPITQFKGEYAFLSNFHPAKVVLFGKEFRSAEHAYQSAKCKHRHGVEVISSKIKAGEAKKAGRTVVLIPNWDYHRLIVMRLVVQVKFMNDAELGRKLMETGDRKLVEGNYWGDRFWGVDLRSGKGANHLGRILMSLRDDIANDWYGWFGKDSKVGEVGP